MSAFDVSQMEAYQKQARDLEFNLEEEEIQRTKVFAAEDQARQFELLRAAGIDESAIQTLEAADGQQAESAVNALDLRTAQVGAFEAAGVFADEYEETFAEQMVQGAGADVGALAVQWYKLGPPSHSCGGDKKLHNEGGHTVGIPECQHSLGKILMYADARGDGAGIADDNDVTVWTWHWYFWHPQHHGHIMVRPCLEYHGYAYNRANDKWYNSKDTETRFTFQCDVWQDRGTSSQVWRRLGSRSWTMYHLVSQNVDRTKWFNHEGHSRDYGNEVVWANKPVAIFVQHKIEAKTEGSGSYARVDFRNHGRYVKNWVWLRFSY